MQRCAQRTCVEVPSILVALGMLLLPISVEAQGSWVVVRSGVGPASTVENDIRNQLAVTLRGAGLSVLSDPEAAQRIEARHSSECPALDTGRVMELRDAVTALEEHAALRQREAARAVVARIRQLSEELGAEIGAEGEVAERLFAACVAEA